MLGVYLYWWVYGGKINGDVNWQPNNRVTTGQSASGRWNGRVLQFWLGWHGFRISKWRRGWIGKARQAKPWCCSVGDDPFQVVLLSSLLTIVNPLHPAIMLFRTYYKPTNNHDANPQFKKLWIWNIHSKSTAIMVILHVWCNHNYSTSYTHALHHTQRMSRGGQTFESK